MSFEGGLVLETAGGVGYMVFVPENSILYQQMGEGETLVFTAMIVREDDVSLYGFADQDSLDMFQKLRSVNGVGAKAALALLSAMPLDHLQKAILFEDPDTLTRANGVGKKTAQRIVLELKDKIGFLNSDILEIGMEGEIISSNSGKEEAIEALISLGYSRSEAAAAVQGIKGDNLTAEEYIKRALRSITS